MFKSKMKAEDGTEHIALRGKTIEQKFEELAEKFEAVEVELHELKAKTENLDSRTGFFRDELKEVKRRAVVSIRIPEASELQELRIKCNIPGMYLGDPDIHYPVNEVCKKILDYLKLDIAYVPAKPEVPSGFALHKIKPKK